MKSTLLKLTLVLVFNLVGGITLRATEPDAQPSPRMIGAQNEVASQAQQSLLPFLDPEKAPVVNAIIKALPEKLSAPGGHKRRILTINYNLHNPMGAAGLLTILRAAEKKYGAFELTEAYTTEGIDAKMLGGFDAVVINNTSLMKRDYAHPEQGDKIWGATVEEKQVLYSFYENLLPGYVKNGGGLFVVHGGILVGGKVYHEMLGATLGAPGSTSVHPPCCYTIPFFGVRMPDPADPLAAAFIEEKSPIKIKTETYVIGPDSNMENASHVILSIDRDTIPKDGFPYGANDYSFSLIWHKPYGKGRVYVCQIGHDEAFYAKPFISRAFLDGIQYVDGDLKVPPPPATTETTTKP